MRKTEILGAIVMVTLILCEQRPARAQQKAEKYEPTWESLREYKEIPKWLRDGKFGIYTHWGVYSVHAFGENTTWYSFGMYADPDSEARKHFEKTFGPLDKIGYKELIPKFTAEKFNADEWADLFQKAGARFAGPVAEHHDGFAMWDTKYSRWNAAKMGPQRDIVGELEKAIKKRGMKYVTAFHHAANWFFFPVWNDSYDTGNPNYSGLYGQPHERGAKRNQAFLDEWYGKIIEVIDNYSPDFIWFDFALDEIPEGYVKDFLAYYYNHAEAQGKEVVVTYKGHDLVPGTGVRDLELGQEPSITYHEWITDSTVDDRGAWGWANDLVFKSPNRLIDNLVDRVSKNGYLLLNVGPKPDGTIPEEARKLLLEMGAWLDLNGEAIYGTSPWTVAGEGPTNLGAATDIGFNEADTVYTSEDIRFTVKGDTIYATFLDWPGEKAVIKTLRTQGAGADEDDSEPAADAPSLVGKTLTTEFDGDVYTWVFREDGQARVSGGEAGDGLEAEYEQDGNEVFISVATEELEGSYDGTTLTFREDETPRYAGFYKEEIKRISMLGDGKELKWKQTRKGLVIETPDNKPCDFAYVIKIERSIIQRSINRTGVVLIVMSTLGDNTVRGGAGSLPGEGVMRMAVWAGFEARQSDRLKARLNRRHMSWSCVWLALLGLTGLALPHAAFAQDASSESETGTLAGRLTLEGNPIPPRKIVINKDVEHCGKAPRTVEDLKLSSDGGIIGAVVEVQGVDPPEGEEWNWVTPEEGYVLRQKGCSFEPYLVVMPSGAKLTVYNNDEVTHNVNTGQWNSMQAKGAGPINQAVSGRSPIRVTCNIHSWMEAWIYPVESPFFAITDEEGNYEIKNVPAGKYRLVVWHPALGRQRSRVEVTAGETTRGEVAIESPN